MLEVWYEKYENQCWYKNTYLVREPNQISRAIQNDEEWNNIHDSGCHFVCLSMILGLNPAYLSSVLIDKDGYFKEDKAIKSMAINGKKTFLVWDENKPNKDMKEVSLKGVYHPVKGVTDITIKFKKVEFENDIEKANDLIAKHHTEGKHIICGYSDHSRLIAGVSDGEYFLWDPDVENRKIKEHLDGCYTLDCFYKEYSNDGDYKDEKAQYWVYSVEFDSVK